MPEERLYVDLKNQIWKRYVALESNMYYARLSGVTRGLEAGVVQPVWILERSEPDESWLLIGRAI